MFLSPGRGRHFDSASDISLQDHGRPRAALPTLGVCLADADLIAEDATRVGVIGLATDRLSSVESAVKFLGPVHDAWIERRREALGWPR